MGNQILKAYFLGTYYFKSKDKTKNYYKLQAVAYEEGNKRALLVDTFITDKEHEIFLNMDFFSRIDLEIIPNLTTGQLRYKLVI